MPKLWCAVMLAPILLTAGVQAATGSPHYVQQCAASIMLGGDPPGTINLDFQLISEANVSSAPVAAIPGTRTVTGLMFRNTANGRQPLVNAFVDFEPTWDFVAAFTKTDGSGHYLLCGLSTSEINISATSPPFSVTYATVDSGADAVVDVEIK